MLSPFPVGRVTWATSVHSVVCSVASRPGSRLRKISTSVSTSVAAWRRCAADGSRTPPTRSPRAAISRRAAGRTESEVNVLVMTATYPPGAVRCRDLMMKWLWIERLFGL